MTQFEILIKKSESAIALAKETADPLLKKFYQNASEGFKSKAQKLSLNEAGKEVPTSDIITYCA